MKPDFRLTSCTPCYGRPQRTLRAVECVVNQDTNGWEAFFIGDGCPIFLEMLDKGVFKPYEERALQNGNEIHFLSMTEHKGGWGYEARNLAFRLSRGKFFLFYDNDDVIKPTHFSNYLAGIENSAYDMVYYDSFIEPINQTRNAELNFGHIGHSEIIVRTELLKDYRQKAQYGQDWDLIEYLKRNGAVISKGKAPEPTYIIKAIGGDDPNRERRTEIDID